MQLLAADIGGTTSRFYLFLVQKNILSLCYGTVFPTDFHNAEELQYRLFSCWPGDIEDLKHLSLAVYSAAGPLQKERIAMTNADCILERTAIQKSLSTPCLLMNDFEAQAWSCLSPVSTEFMRVMPYAEHHVSNARENFSCKVGHAALPIAVLGAGTGLGVSWLLPDKEYPRVLPSEFGHTPFPFMPEEWDFENFLRKKISGIPVTIEHVLSGRGLVWLYEYTCGRILQPQVFTSAPGFSDSICCAWFARFYGRLCRTVALSLMPQSLVIAGGLAEKTPALIQHEEFFREFFKATGEQKAFLKNLPLWLAKHPLNGVWGAAQSGFMYALQRGMTES